MTSANGRENRSASSPSLPEASTLCQREFKVRGMTCVNCARSVERVLEKKTPGVREARVNFATEFLQVTFDPTLVDESTLARSVETAGFCLVRPEPANDKAAHENTEERALWIDLSVGLIFTLPLMALSMLRDFSLIGPWSHEPWVNGLFLFLALPVQFFSGASFYRGAYHSLRNGRPNMDVLVALGSSAAFLFSVLAMAVPSLGIHVYFETGAMIITLIKLGKLLENRSKSNARRSIERLLTAMPRLSRRLDLAGGESHVPTEEIRTGDRLAVLPGEMVPVDGEIRSGASSLDESLITGESMPRDKGPGDPIFGGSINLQARIEMEATSVGEMTVLARVSRLVREALSTQAPLQQLADRVSAVFVPLILLIAFTVFGLWWVVGGEFSAALSRMIAILVVACPCALGLATPMAVMVGLGRGARMGVLFREGATLERLARATVVHFDKTGTLTQGRPSVAAYEGENIENPREFKDLVAGIVAGSNHPLSQAIFRFFQSEPDLRPITPAKTRFWSGLGQEAESAGHHVRIGHPDWLNGSEFPELFRSFADSARRDGRTLVGVEMDGRVVGLWALEDAIRPEAREAVEEIHRLGCVTRMLTGDHSGSAEAVARNVGVTDFQANLLPDAKCAFLRNASRSGEVAVMVGDGYNDAPALASADVGIAIGTGTDIAKEAAHVTLMSNHLRSVPAAIRLARATVRTIRQNLAWAFGYNLLLVPLAAGVLFPFETLPHWLRELHPASAAAAMILSSLTVVTNSLRLSSFKGDATSPRS